MDWLKKTAAKVREWFRRLFVKKEEGDVLDKLARKVLALGPSELQEKVDKFRCGHSFAIVKQVWVRIEKKKFELRNEVLCSKCKTKEVHEIS